MYCDGKNAWASRSPGSAPGRSVMAKSSVPSSTGILCGRSSVAVRVSCPAARVPCCGQTGRDDRLLPGSALLPGERVLPGLDSCPCFASHAQASRPRSRPCWRQPSCRCWLPPRCHHAPRETPYRCPSGLLWRNWQGPGPGDQARSSRHGRSQQGVQLSSVRTWFGDCPRQFRCRRLRGRRSTPLPKPPR